MNIIRIKNGMLNSFNLFCFESGVNYFDLKNAMQRRYIVAYARALLSALAPTLCYRMS